MNRIRLLVLALLALPQMSALAQLPVSVAPFRSVALRSGGEIVIRHGEAQRVTILQGERTRISVIEGGKLLIDNRGRSHRIRIRVEIVTPVLEGVSVEDGGRLAVEGGFPRQGSISAAVANGGAIDLRRLPVGQATAAVSQGGSIAVRPSDRLVAAVSHGGVITYWGDPSVTPAIRDGGAVVRGEPGGADGPLSELATGVRPIASIPPLPPLGH